MKVPLSVSFKICGNKVELITKTTADVKSEKVIQKVYQANERKAPNE